MTDLLVRTRHEALVVRRLPSVTDAPTPAPTRWTRRRVTALAFVALLAAGVCTWAALDDGAVDHAPAPAVTLPAE